MKVKGFTLTLTCTIGRLVPEVSTSSFRWRETADAGATVRLVTCFSDQLTVSHSQRIHFATETFLCESLSDRTPLGAKLHAIAHHLATGNEFYVSLDDDQSDTPAPQRKLEDAHQPDAAKEKSGAVAMCTKWSSTAMLQSVRSWYCMPRRLDGDRTGC